ncbi:NAD-dependent succinate-semialdehyde dehydrogenase [Glaciimonas sp. PCH181]|uniref:NAD-dependent succinate-semialdehyde dehydrogenase n=1 Tax=Glaciimonas sp. PCH181 TaxID=2133943 RepID=UPI000D3C5A99|nr:NAD-dependent succinate-semialdehyde dehydrogenase [Glaciimonas sp. PCH181]PUA19316.1 succinate-semialdehyde dehydrogenase (NADP(+)) [Glaciimonas sp. PCH181]
MNLRDANLFHQQSYINGQWCDADNRSTLAVNNPADNNALGSVPNMGEAETRRAIHAADAALPAWRAKTGKERGAILRRWHDLILANIDDLAEIMTLEQGKPLSEARGEIQYALSFVDWFSEEAKRVYGDVLPQTRSDQRLLALRQPIGVCAAITAWNFPSALVTRKVSPALAAGCTVVLKPAELTPYSALALAELAHRAGFPAGVLNIVTGNPVAIGKELTSSSIVKKLTFTGSTPTGRLLMAQCASNIKKLSLELGGNAPFIVFEDGDIDQAVDGLMISKFRNAGQTCVCANRILVHESIAEVFSSKLKLKVEALKVGNGMTPDVVQGPLINRAAVDKVERLVADAIDKGAKLITGGSTHPLGGLFYTPTLLTGITGAMAIAHEEIFGPVLAITTFRDEEEAIRQANDSPSGLAAYFYADSMERIWRVMEKLEYGMVGVNTGMISNEVGPFGGIKESGVGREGSRYGMEEFMELKYVCMSGRMQ